MPGVEFGHFDPRHRGDVFSSFRRRGDGVVVSSNRLWT